MCPKKRGFSAAARREQLDNSSKPRRVIWAYCHRHEGSYYFYDVRVQPLKPHEEPQWQDEPDMQKVRALCMFCDQTALLFVGADELEEHRYTAAELCTCGLPAYHHDPPPEFSLQYNATPVPCRPNPNGRADLR